MRIEIKTERSREISLESPQLVQEMINHDPNGCGKIQAANTAPDGNFVAGIGVPYVKGKAKSLLPEKQIIPKAHFRARVGLGGMFAKSNKVSLPHLISPFQKDLKAFMVPYVHLMPVV